MHQSGIEVDQELNKAFNDAHADTSVGWLSITIEDEKFKFVEKGEGSFDKVQSTLVEKTPLYICIRRADKWLLVSFVPDNSNVRKKMLFASSISAIRSGLDTTKFINPNFSISQINECTEAEYVRVNDTGDRQVVMSWEEKEKKETAFEHAHAMGQQKASVIADVPIKIADNALEAIQSLGGDTSSFNSCELILAKEDETLNVGLTKDMSIADIAASFPPKEPRFYLHSYNHTNPTDSSTCKRLVFVYYCPNTANPRLKMLYSTSKSHILRCFKELKMDTPFNVECDEPKELTDELLLKDIYPQKEVDTSFKKPTPRAKPRGKPKIAKFQA